MPLLRVEADTGKVFVGSEELAPPLADLEFRLLAYLYERKGQICSRDEIIQSVYLPRPDSREMPVDGVFDQAIGSLIYRLRKRIEPRHGEPTCIKTILGRGFRLEHAVKA